MYENRYTHVNNNTYKKVSWNEIETQQEVGYFEFSRHICDIFAISGVIL